MRPSLSRMPPVARVALKDRTRRWGPSRSCCSTGGRRRARDFWLMAALRETPYVPEMATEAYMGVPVGAVDRRGPFLAQCLACRHSEFVHGDDAARLCLYCECECRGITPSPVTQPLFLR
jgi:hypothetical protein